MYICNIYNILYIYYLYTYAFIPDTFMYRYFYYVQLFLENSSVFSYYFFAEIFGITWTYSKKLDSLKTSAESVWVILGLILVVLLYLLRAVKPFLIIFMLLQCLLH